MQVLQRIATTAIEALIAFFVIVPILLIFDRVWLHNRKRTAAYCFFSFYLSALIAIVGMPTLYNFKFEFFLQPIPIAGMEDDVLNSFLNVILFVPLGLFLPLLSKSFERAKNTMLFGFFTTLIIESSQLFAHRKTDINDIITNTVGTLVGFLLARLLLKKRDVSADGKNFEIYVVVAVTFLVMFLIQPPVSVCARKLVS